MILHSDDQVEANKIVKPIFSFIKLFLTMCRNINK